MNTRWNHATETLAVLASRELREGLMRLCEALSESIHARARTV